MREGWTYKTFRDVCFSIYDGDWIEKKDQSPDGIRLIQTGNIGVGRFIPKDDSKKFISLDTFNRLRCTEIKEGDILISRLPQPLGRSCVLPKLETRCITAVDCCILRLNSKITLPQYFIYYTQSQNYFSEINSQSSGTTRARITRKKLEETKIPLAPLSEQKRIVSRLDASFAHIDALKANAEKQLSDAKALFQKALEKAMEPKEGWEEKKMGEIADIKGGKRVPKGYKLESFDTGYKYIRVADFTDEGTIDESNIQFISKEVFEQIKRYTITDKDVYISIAGTIGKSGIIPSSLNGANLTENACKLVFTKPVNKRYVYLFTKSDIFVSQIEKATKQASQPKLALTRLAEVKMPIPPLSEQQAIVTQLDQLSENVKRLQEIQEKTIKECDALKQAILREVFE